MIRPMLRRGALAALLTLAPFFSFHAALGADDEELPPPDKTAGVDLRDPAVIAKGIEILVRHLRRLLPRQRRPGRQRAISAQSHRSHPRDAAHDDHLRSQARRSLDAGMGRCPVRREDLDGGCGDRYHCGTPTLIPRPKTSRPRVDRRSVRLRRNRGGWVRSSHIKGCGRWPALRCAVIDSRKLYVKAAGQHCAPYLAQTAHHFGAEFDYHVSNR